MKRTSVFVGGPCQGQTHLIEWENDRCDRTQIVMLTNTDGSLVSDQSGPKLPHVYREIVSGGERSVYAHHSLTTPQALDMMIGMLPGVLKETKRSP